MAVSIAFLHVTMVTVLLQGWSKGVVFVNGVNIGRYWSVGPQHSLYIPAPLLRRGPNTVSQYTNDHYSILSLSGYGI